MPMYEEVKRMLQSYRYCLQRIDRNAELIEELQSKAEKITTTYSLTPGGPWQEDSKATIVAKIVDLKRELAEDTEQLKAALALVRFMISTLDDYQQRAVLEYRYVCGYSWRMIRAALHYSRTQIYEIHIAALENIAESLKSEQK